MYGDEKKGWGDGGHRDHGGPKWVSVSQIKFFLNFFINIIIIMSTTSRILWLLSMHVALLGCCK